MKPIEGMTRKELELTPHRKWDEDVGEFDSLIILPAEIKVWQIAIYQIRQLLHRISSIFAEPEIYDVRGLHDSGYRCMDFIACREGVPLCRLSGCSDVIHINGIGGYGKRWLATFELPRMVPPIGWSIDCLRKSGLLRIFCNGKLSAGLALSSFEIYAERADSFEISEKEKE